MRWLPKYVQAMTNDRTLKPQDDVTNRILVSPTLSKEAELPLFETISYTEDKKSSFHKKIHRY